MASQSSSSSSTRRMRNWSYVRGIPTSCAKCGSSIVTKVSKTELNPYRRYYRCAKVAGQTNAEESHCFKWVDEAFEDELLDFKQWSIKIENDTNVLGTGMTEMQKQTENAVYDVVNGAVSNVKMQMKSLVAIVVVCVIVFVGIVKLI